MKISKKLTENLLNLANGEKIHLNYYTGSGRFQKKSTDWIEKIYCELLQFVEKTDLIYSNDAPRGGFCGDYIQVKNIEKFKEVFSKQIQELEEQKREEEEQKKLEEEKRKQEKIEKAKKYLPLFEEKKEEIKKIKEKEALGYRTLENLLTREEIYNFFILYNNKIFKI